MYQRLARTGFRNRGGVRAPGWVRAHIGGFDEPLKRHRASTRNWKQKASGDQREYLDQLHLLATDERMLRCAWEHLRRLGGGAPGPDGFRFQDFRGAALWDLLRPLRDELRTRGYRPGKERTINIPKGPGRGMRTLVIQNLRDRVVQRALKDVAEPLLDPTFDEHSFGFRPKLSHRHALARAARIAQAEQRWVWVLVDIKDAFSSVPVPRLIQVLQKALPAADFIDLIKTALGGTRQRGLRQGGPLSPILLNVYLDHFLDKQWRLLHPDIPMLRYADDIAILCQNEQEARKALENLRKLLTPAGFKLKQKAADAIHDLRTSTSARWLGFGLQLSGAVLTLNVTDQLWAQLEERLLHAHEEAHSPLVANKALRGWINSLGPCFGTVDFDTFYSELHGRASALAFDEIPTAQEVHDFWQRAYARWRKLRQDQSEGNTPLEEQLRDGTELPNRPASS